MSSDTETDTSTELIFLPESKRLVPSPSSSSCDLSSESEVDTDSDKQKSEEWSNAKGNPQIFKIYKSSIGVKKNNEKVQNCREVEDFYSLFVSDEIIDEVVQLTNAYATDEISKNKFKYLENWVPTDRNEIKRLFGLLIWMGLVRLPSINLYWSKNKCYYQKLPHSVLSKARCKALLNILQFGNKDTSDTNAGLANIKFISDKIQKNYMKYYFLPELMCITDTLIPTYGQTIFKQYHHQYKKAHGIKIFKLCNAIGYTFSYCIYGEVLNVRKRVTIPSSIIMELCTEIFYLGYTLCTNKKFTSFQLANQLSRRKTYLIGEISIRHKDLPEKVTKKKLKRGQFASKVNKDKICVLKWKGRQRNVVLLSTKYYNEMGIVMGSGYKKFNVKPKMLIDYSKGSVRPDLYKQLNDYNSPFCKSMKWYTRIMFELLLNTCVYNAFCIYREMTEDNSKIQNFRKNLAMSLMSHNDD